MHIHQISFAELNKARKSKPANASVRIALLGDTPTQLLAQVIDGSCALSGINAEVWEADFNQIDLQTLNPHSALYEFNPDYVILFHSSEKLKHKFYQTPLEKRSSFSQIQLEYCKTSIEAILKYSTARVLFYNFYEVDDSIYGNYASKTAYAFLPHLRKLNVALQDWVRSIDSVYLLDVASDYHRLGKSFCFAPNIYVQSGFVWSLDFLPFAAKRVSEVISALKGNFKKCLILDLDDTIWGGTVGDDGWQNLQLGDLGIGKAFTELQYWIKELQQRGIIICVCSKNDEVTAREVFEKHPDMILSMQDVSVFIANWENKADNIRSIRDILNIGFDSMVFIDNSAFERNLVRTELPEVCVPELPEDPAEYLLFLQSLNLFETTSLSDTDSNRTQQYREEALRQSEIKHFTNVDDYLKSLEMYCNVSGFDDYNIPRVAQLTQRSNQFNLRTVRYTEADIRRMAGDKNYICLAFTLTDKFGDYGLISVAILKRLHNDEYFIDTWLMSCRVLKRGVEQFVMNTLVNKVSELGATRISAEYLPSGKNKMVETLLHTMQFKLQDNTYRLTLIDYIPYVNYIKQALLANNI